MFQKSVSGIGTPSTTNIGFSPLRNILGSEKKSAPLLITVSPATFPDIDSRTFGVIAFWSVTPFTSCVA